MKTPRIVNAIGHIDDDLINSATKSKKVAKKNIWIKWTSLVASFAVIIIVAAVAVPTLFGDENTTLPILSGNNTVTNDNGSTTSQTINQENTHSNNVEPTTSGGNDNTTTAINNDSTTQSVIDNEAHTTGNSNQQEHNTQTPEIVAPSTTQIAEISTTPIVEPSTTVSTTIANNEEQQYTYKDVIVGYDTAKAYFKHPILPCDRNDFTGYNVLLCTPNENNNESGTDCLSLTYLFTNGSVNLRDQDKTGKVTPTGKQYEYRGRTFYVHTPEFNGDQLRIGYYPSGENGIAYQAYFNGRANINEIIDLILSLELKK